MKGNKKAKKRVQGYEGDEVFKAGKEVIFSFPEEGEFIVRALDGKLNFVVIIYQEIKFIHRCYSALVPASHAGTS